MRSRGVWLLLALLAGSFVLIVIVAGGGSNDSGTDSKPATASSGTSADRQLVRRKVSGPHDDPVPILMYHVIADPPADATYTDLYVSASSFRRQIDLLVRKGYHGVTLDSVYDYWHDGYALPSKPVVVSFDDGYESQFRNALPVLRSHHWPGVLNLELKNLKPSWGLRPAKIRALIAAGWEIDAHTIHHLDVTTLDASGLREEIAGSRRAIQRRFDVPVNFFCYPSGRFNDAAIAAVRRAGFKGATTTEPGIASPSPPYELARIRINRGDSPQSVAQQVASPIS